MRFKGVTLSTYRFHCTISAMKSVNFFAFGMLVCSSSQTDRNLFLVILTHYNIGTPKFPAGTLHQKTFTEVTSPKSNADINDLCSMYRIWEKQSHVRYKILVFVAFTMLQHKMQQKNDRLEVQKMAKIHIDDIENYIDKQIEVGGTWKFEDLRCRDFMLRWVDFLVEAEKFVQYRADDWNP